MYVTREVRAMVSYYFSFFSFKSQMSNIFPRFRASLQNSSRLGAKANRVYRVVRLGSDFCGRSGAKKNERGKRERRWVHERARTVCIPRTEKLQRIMALRAVHVRTATLIFVRAILFVMATMNRRDHARARGREKEMEQEGGWRARPLSRSFRVISFASVGPQISFCRAEIFSVPRIKRTETNTITFSLRVPSPYSVNVDIQRAR